MTPRRVLLKRLLKIYAALICGEMVFRTGSRPLRWRLKKRREKEHLISSGDSMSSSLQAGHQLASGGKTLIR